MGQNVALNLVHAKAPNVHMPGFRHLRWNRLQRNYHSPLVILVVKGSQCPPIFPNDCLHDFRTRNIASRKGVVMQFSHARGCHMVFWKPVPPLQRVPRLACSVASLSRYPGHQLLRSCSLHCKTFTGYLLGKELPSAYTATHSMQDCIPAP